MKYRIINTEDISITALEILLEVNDRGKSLLSEQESLEIFAQTWSEGFADAKHDEGGLTPKYKNGFKQYAKEFL